MNRLLIFLCLIANLSCGAKPQEPSTPAELPVAQWRFFDIDTRKPIPGVWVNFAWNGHPTERGMSTCVRGVLAQSDADGWVRNTAREPHWRVAPGAFIFKPGYQRMGYTMGVGNEANSTFIISKINQDRRIYGQYPAWEEKLRGLGYAWADHNWTKQFPRGDIPDALREPDRPERYLMTYRSIPSDIEQTFVFLGHECLEAGAENIGLSPERISDSDKERALASTRYLCMPDWDSVMTTRIDFSEFVTRSLWLLKDRNGELDLLKLAHPKVYTYMKLDRYYVEPERFSKEIRTAYCDWLEEKTGVELYEN
jgi:hypothetical protein